MRIYVTHCSCKKDDSLKNTGKSVTPDKLYMGDSIRSFMGKCKAENVTWAIFSDKYGVWFPEIEHEWYDKSPNDVTSEEFDLLLSSFDQSLQGFEEIWFFRKPEGLHCFYERLLNESNLHNRVKIFCDVEQIQ